MSVWLKMLPLEVAEMTDLVEPHEDIKEKEQLVEGDISEDTKKLYSLWKSVEHQAAVAQADYQFQGTDDLHARVHELMAKARVLQAIFWVAVNDELHLWAHRETCAIRKGWRVVEFEQKPGLFDLFGGGG